MPSIRKVRIEVERGTSLVLTMPRFEVPLYRDRLPPSTSVKVHAIQPGTEGPDDVLTITCDEARAGLRTQYGHELFERVFPSEAAFDKEFTAVAKLDSVQEGAAVRADMSVLADLLRVAGVNEPLAQRLYDAGIRTVTELAGASPEALLAVRGMTLGQAEALALAAKVVLESPPDQPEP
jgi:hypothetical protein